MSRRQALTNYYIVKTAARPSWGVIPDVKDAVRKRMKAEMRSLKQNPQYINMSPQEQKSVRQELIKRFSGEEMRSYTSRQDAAKMRSDATASTKVKYKDKLQQFDDAINNPAIDLGDKTKANFAADRQKFLDTAIQSEVDTAQAKKNKPYMNLINKADEAKKQPFYDGKGGPLRTPSREEFKNMSSYEKGVFNLADEAKARDIQESGFLDDLKDRRNPPSSTPNSTTKPKQNTTAYRQARYAERMQEVVDKSHQMRMDEMMEEAKRNANRSSKTPTKPKVNVSVTPSKSTSSVASSAASGGGGGGRFGLLGKGLLATGLVGGAYALNRQQRQLQQSRRKASLTRGRNKVRGI